MTWKLTIITKTPKTKNKLKPNNKKKKQSLNSSGLKIMAAHNSSESRSRVPEFSTQWKLCKTAKWTSIKTDLWFIVVHHLKTLQKRTLSNAVWTIANCLVWFVSNLPSFIRIPTAPAKLLWPFFFLFLLLLDTIKGATVHMGQNQCLQCSSQFIYIRFWCRLHQHT